MKKGDTRGLSTVIATLLVILLVIVAVAIVWGVVKKIIVNNSNQISLGEFTIDLEILSIKQNVDDVSIKVKRNSGVGELEGIVFSIFDGKNTHLYEKHNISLEALQIKTFVVDYKGTIVSVSIYPILITESGKSTKGNVADTYFKVTSGGEDSISPDCIPVCTGKECGDNGCGGICGTCSGLTPHCVLGECGAESGGNPDCSCSTTTCSDETCSDGLEGSCSGLLQPDCTDEFDNPIMCGGSQNECGNCGTCAEGICDEGMCCPTGYHNNGGTCEIDCIVNCTDKECGNNGCDGFCGYCDTLYNISYNCNASGLCEMCTPNCGLKECGSVPNGCGESCGNCSELYGPTYNCNLDGICEECQPDCGLKECGIVPNGCGESCGNCSELYGYPEGSCTSEGICVPPEMSLDSGTVLFVWPTPIGRNYFVSGDLPAYGDDYNLSEGRFVKITGADNYKRCYQILTIDYPVNQGQYTVIKVSTASTDIEEGNSYEIWKSLAGCNS